MSFSFLNAAANNVYVKSIKLFIKKHQKIIKNAKKELLYEIAASIEEWRSFRWTQNKIKLFSVDGWFLFLKKKKKFAVYQSAAPVFFRLKDLFQSKQLFEPNTNNLLLISYLFFKKSLLMFFLCFSVLLFAFYTLQLPFLKSIAVWLVFGLLVYWLLSGFNFFMKRYRFSKYTSAIQRFWKRTLTIFWISEIFMFSLFFYYATNSSQEPVFMYDQIALYTHQLLNMDSFLISSFYVVFLLNLIMILLFKIKTSTYRQLTPIFFLVSVGYISILFSESYQFYYIVNFYEESTWQFNEDDNVWDLEHDSPRTRTRNHYIAMLIILKFWHYIFIFGSWIFFLMKTFEQRRVRYSLFSMNYQNLIVFYIMSWCFMFVWFKFIFRRFLDKSFFWFFISNRVWYSTVLLEDLYQYTAGVFVSIFEHQRTADYPLMHLKLFSVDSFSRGDLLKNFLWATFN